ncbi:hypothetical protein [Sphingomonas sp. PAMC 26621]|uniref:hypothetical protein n=1 Tax=Sphingomonas sp. PAMC 26621 TaxID=1112213 RepID=UPI0002893739|nr:hypothetical protein [Sphingomonas sp. PAMC 26621]
MKRLLLALCVLTGCQKENAPGEKATPPATALEAAAIQAGVIPDPNSTDITGLYVREADRVCVVPSATGYRIGVTVDYDDREHCGATGVVTRSGETLHVAFDTSRGGGCSFDARFDGDRIVFPGRLPAGCQALCTEHAAISGLALDRLSESASEASTLRGPRGTLLCGDDVHP